jgi:hypothetical protein
VRSGLQGAKAKVKRFAVIAEEREALLQSAAQAQVDWCGGPEQRVNPSTFIGKEVSAVVILAEKFYRLPQRRRILPKFVEAISRVAIYRRCPNPIPMLNACCRSAPTVRFICFEILVTGVRFFECLRSSARSALLQGTCLRRRFVFFAMSAPTCERTA